MIMDRIPTYAGNAVEKDRLDIFYWAFEKTPWERLQESWRLHCLNHNINPSESRLDKTKSLANKRQ